MKILRNLTVAAVVAALAGTGCYGTTTVRGRAVVTAPSARLEYIGPDVQVVADSDYPVFYHQNYYWRYDNGVWLRSEWPDRAFVRVQAAPTAVLRIDRPYAYVHYHTRHMGNRRPVRVYHY